MTERLRTNPYGAYCQGEPKVAPQSSSEGLGTKKTMLVLVVVVGCFAVLWPKLFYPMLVNNANSHIKPGPVDKTTGCCDVISEMDVDTIKIMSQLCSTIIDDTGETLLTPKEIVSQCRKAVLETCGIDISAALQDRISLGHSAKQILEEVRSLNGSLCLKYNFGVSPWRLGVPHRVNINLDPINSIRQERPSPMRTGMVHPAFKERGRAIPESDTSTPRRTGPPPRIVEGRPGPVPGIRPSMGGPGHMVPPSKQANYGFMGVLMPIYTVGFIIFFSYTIMKLVFKKKPSESSVGSPLYPPCDTDEHFQKEVFEANRHYFNRPNRDNSKIGDEELDQLRKRLRETELAMERIVQQMAQAPLATQDEIRPNGSLPKEEEQGSVTVMGMETTASCESGKKWSRPDSPVLPHPSPAPPKEPSTPPQQIFLEGALPPQSQLLVADSATEAQKDSEDDSPVVLAGKMTLSVISLDSETGTEDSANSGKREEISDEERRRSSSNTSEEFEKINAADLEEQINNIIEEAESLALAEENRFSLDRKFEELSKEEMPKAPQINEKELGSDILEEIKNQFNLEDDLFQVLKEREPEGKVGLPVTDIIKEFLNNEEQVLLEKSPYDHSTDTSRLETESSKTEVVEKQEDEKDLDPGVLEEAKQLESLYQEIVADIQSQGDGELKIVESQTEPLEVEDTEKHQEQPDLDTVMSKEVKHLESLCQEIIGEMHKQEEKGEAIVESQDKHHEPLKVESDIYDAPLELEKPTTEEVLKAEDTDLIQAHELLDVESDIHDGNLELGKSPTEVLRVEEDTDLIQVAESDNNEVAEASLPSEIGEKRLTEDQEASALDFQQLEEKPQENVKNMADVLLQGLMVKDDDESSNLLDTEQTSVIAEAPTSESSKKLEILETQEERPSANSDQDQRKEHAAEIVPQEDSFDVADIEEQVIEDIEYEDESENEDLDEDELIDFAGVNYEDRESLERRLNGEDADSSRNGAGNSETAAENEISEDDLENEEDVEIEEIIEYVDNTDDEGEEVVEINGNEHRHADENGAN